MMDIQLYIQKMDKKIWSHEEIWQVPPLPGPSQGNMKPYEALSDTNLEERETSTPFITISTVVCRVNA
jgi:hypothetical protein